MGAIKLSGLEGKLTNVNIGDQVELRSDGLNISGYVLYLSTKEIKLSHENPFSTKRGFKAHNDFFRKELTAGNRTYRLKGFEHYDVLKPYEKPKEP
ncbi:hypothetical protein KY347_05055 [Candidatus Woesearchaeota archaeon]|nr:hypothetical protein [Candidatus Woesearchaeota archaeon]